MGMIWLLLMLCIRQTMQVEYVTHAVLIVKQSEFCCHTLFAVYNLPADLPLCTIDKFSSIMGNNKNEAILVFYFGAGNI